MVSIRRQRQIRLFLFIIIISTFLITTLLVFGLYPYGLHKKNMKDVKIPKDSILYLSVKNSKNSINKIVDSIYAYRISHDESMFEFSLILKSVSSFFENMENNKYFLVKKLSRYMYGRNAAVLFWNDGFDKRVENSEIYFIFDIGRLPSFVFNLFFNKDNITIGNINYDIKKRNYDNAIIRSLENSSKTFIYFTSYKGLLICTKEYKNMEKIIDFLNSKSSTLEEMDILRDRSDEYLSDISLYINKKRYDSVNINENLLFTPLKYFPNSKTIYATSKLTDKGGQIDVYTDYEYGGSERSILYNSGGAVNIQNYLSLKSTVLYLGLKSKIAGLYPLLYNDIKSITDSKISKNALNYITRFNNLFLFNEIIKELKGEVGFAYLKNQNSNIDYPLFAFEMDNEALLIPIFEKMLASKYGSIIKTEKTYNNNFIYTYDLNGLKLNYLSKNNVFFVSENENALKILIDGFNDKNTLSEYISKEAPNIKQSDYIFSFDFIKGENILEKFELPLRTWSYPTSVIIASTVGENSTHIQIDFKANLEKNNIK